MTDPTPDITALDNILRRSITDHTTEEIADHVLAYRRVENGESRIDTIDVERYTRHPRRATGNAVVASVQSLLDLTDRYAGPDTVVHIDVPLGSTNEARVVSVINDHSGESPGWRDHRVTLPIKATPEWDAWLANDGRLMDQETFATLIEDLAPTIHAPDSATLLEIAQTFHATTDTRFSSAVRLSSGQVKLNYDETITATAGSDGGLTIPTEISLLLPIAIDGPAMAISARLRYRAASGKLSLGYALNQPHVAWRQSCDHTAERVREHFAERGEVLVVDGTA